MTSRYHCLFEAIMTKEPTLEELKRQLRAERAEVDRLRQRVVSMQQTIDRCDEERRQMRDQYYKAIDG